MVDQTLSKKGRMPRAPSSSLSCPTLHLCRKKAALPPPGTRGLDCPPAPGTSSIVSLEEVTQP